MERSFNNNGFNREKHKAICVKCNQDCEVPFKPLQGKPVYCQDCYKKMKR